MGLARPHSLPPRRALEPTNCFKGVPQHDWLHLPLQLYKVLRQATVRFQLRQPQVFPEQDRRSFNAGDDFLACHFKDLKRGNLVGN